MVLALLATATATACQRPRASDEGAMAQEFAAGDALARSAARASQASPSVVSAAAHGAPVRMSSRH